MHSFPSGVKDNGTRKWWVHDHCFPSVTVSNVCLSDFHLSRNHLFDSHCLLWCLGDDSWLPLPGKLNKDWNFNPYAATTTCVWSTIISSLFQWYLPWESFVPGTFVADGKDGSTEAGATVISLMVFFSYIIVLNTVVPISLYVRYVQVTRAVVNQTIAVFPASLCFHNKKHLFPRNSGWFRGPVVFHWRRFKHDIIAVWRLSDSVTVGG